MKAALGTSRTCAKPAEAKQPTFDRGDRITLTGIARPQGHHCSWNSREDRAAGEHERSCLNSAMCACANAEPGWFQSHQAIGQKD